MLLMGVGEASAIRSAPILRSRTARPIFTRLHGGLPRRALLTRVSLVVGDSIVPRLPKRHSTRIKRVARALTDAGLRVERVELAPDGMINLFIARTIETDQVNGDTPDDVIAKL
jgi:hypothetical protein